MTRPGHCRSGRSMGWNALYLSDGACRMVMDLLASVNFAAIRGSGDAKLAPWMAAGRARYGRRRPVVSRSVGAAEIGAMPAPGNEMDERIMREFMTLEPDLAASNVGRLGNGRPAHVANEEPLAAQSNKRQQVVVQARHGTGE